MNEIINKFLLAEEKFISDMHLKQLEFTYSACDPFTKNNKRTRKIKKTGNWRYTYRNELHKACFKHDMAYCRF